MLLNIKLQRLCKSHHLQCITSSKDSEKLEKSKGQGRRLLLDARGLRALRRHCITHRPDSVIDITKWAQEYFQKPLSVNTIRRAICRCQLKLYHAKSKPYVNMVQKRRRVLWAKAHLKLTVSKWKSILWSDESKFDILVGNHRRRVLRAKEEGDLPACHQHSVQKPASLMVWGCISAYGMDSLHVLEGTMNAERYIKVLKQHMLPSRWRLFQGRPCVFQQDNAKPHTAAITTAWLHSRRVRVLNWPACSPDLSPIENIFIIKWKIRQKTTTNSSAAGNLYQARMGPNSNTKTPETHNLDSQTSSNCFWKEEEMLHHGKHAPVPTILRAVAGIKFEMSSFCA